MKKIKSRQLQTKFTSYYKKKSVLGKFKRIN